MAKFTRKEVEDVVVEFLRKEEDPKLTREEAIRICEGSYIDIDDFVGVDVTKEKIVEEMEYFQMVNDIHKIDKKHDPYLRDGKLPPIS